MAETSQSKATWARKPGVLVSKQDVCWSSGCQLGERCSCGTSVKVHSECRLVRGALCWVKAVINSAKGRSSPIFQRLDE